MNLFLVKIKYLTTTERGLKKIVSSLYLFDALSFTEAESKAVEEFSALINDSFVVTEIKKAHYAELITTIHTSADKYYNCKVNYITLDEKSGAEKKTPAQILVQAESTDDASARLTQAMKGSMADYQVASIVETKIMDYFLHKA